MVSPVAILFLLKNAPNCTSERPYFQKFSGRYAPILLGTAAYTAGGLCHQKNYPQRFSGSPLLTVIFPPLSIFLNETLHMCMCSIVYRRLNGMSCLMSRTYTHTHTHTHTPTHVHTLCNTHNVQHACEMSHTHTHTHNIMKHTNVGVFDPARLQGL